MMMGVTSTSQVDTHGPKDPKLTALENRMYDIALGMMNGYTAPLSGAGRVPILNPDGSETGEFQNVRTQPSPYLSRNALGNTQRHEPNGLFDALTRTALPEWNPSLFFEPVTREETEEEKAEKARKRKKNVNDDYREGGGGNDYGGTSGNKDNNTGSVRA
jgi:hypothetical protein